jgi:hypothetical protein
MKVPKARLFDLRTKEQQARLDQISGEKKDIALAARSAATCCTLPDDQGSSDREQSATSTASWMAI